ncbi:MAG: DUF3095 domain-containing protein [Chloroflexota bacterium]
MSNINFFHDLPPMDNLKQITDINHYTDVPRDWLIALTDVRDSTDAIDSGRYKAVNTMAAATITAILNSISNTDVPFLFGGDGAAVVVPPTVADQVRDALGAVRQLAKTSFDLDIRAGIVPVATVLDDGYVLKVGKVNMSENFQQPVFTGGGLAYADDLIKFPHTADLYLIADDVVGEADFSGFECRWSRHPASNGEVLSLLVKATSHKTERNHQIYDHVLEEITKIYGNAEQRHPIKLDQMRVATNPQQYKNELGWKEGKKPSLWSMLSLMFWSIGGYFLWKYIDKIWDKYKTTVRASTDHEKFDDMLRMTISGTAEQRKQLEDFLYVYQSVGELSYGMHVADHSLMTCIVFDRFGRQVHFLDADAGGYAMAAKQLKAQLKNSPPETIPASSIA